MDMRFFVGSALCSVLLLVGNACGRDCNYFPSDAFDRRKLFKEESRFLDGILRKKQNALQAARVANGEALTDPRGYFEPTDIEMKQISFILRGSTSEENVKKAEGVCRDGWMLNCLIDLYDHLTSEIFEPWSGKKIISFLYERSYTGMSFGHGAYSSKLNVFKGFLYGCIASRIQALLDSCGEGDMVFNKPFAWACSVGDVPLVTALREKGVLLDWEYDIESGGPPLVGACENGSCGTVAFLLRSRGNISAESRSHSLLGVCYNHAIIGPKRACAIAKLLIDSGADVNVVDDTGWLPLDIACDACAFDLAELLINSGANVNAVGFEGWLPLHRACDACNFDLAELLIGSGADVNAAGDTGWLPLHRVCNACNFDLAELLIRSGASVNAVDNEDRTALHLACTKGFFEGVRLLLDSGAAKNIIDSNHCTPLIIACINGRSDIVEALLSGGAAVNYCVHCLVVPHAPGHCIYTPLHWACSKGYLDIVKKLIEYGAAIDVVANPGGTSIDVARRNGHDAIVRFLEQCRQEGDDGPARKKVRTDE